MQAPMDLPRGGKNGSREEKFLHFGINRKDEAQSPGAHLNYSLQNIYRHLGWESLWLVACSFKCSSALGERHGHDLQGVRSVYFANNTWKAGWPPKLRAKCSAT